MNCCHALLSGIQFLAAKTLEAAIITCISLAVFIWTDKQHFFLHLWEVHTISCFFASLATLVLCSAICDSFTSGNYNVQVSGDFDGRSNVSVDGSVLAIGCCRSVSIANGRVFVNGKEVEKGPTSRELDFAKKVQLHLYPGDAKELSVEAKGCGTVNVHGAAHEVRSGGGRVNVEGPVAGSVSSDGGSVSVNGDCGHGISSNGGSVYVGGSATGDVLSSGGSVRIGGDVGGRVSSGGGSVRTNRGWLGL